MKSDNVNDENERRYCCFSLSSSRLWSGALKLPHEHQFTEFIENLGTGQLVGRQVLASPCHGEIQVGLRDQHSLLEVEIVRARNLLQKALYKMPPGRSSISSTLISFFLLLFSTLCQSLSTRRENVHGKATYTNNTSNTGSSYPTNSDLQRELSR